MVVGLLRPTTGEVVIDGVSMHDPAQAAERQRLRRRIQMVFQSPYASLNPRWRALDIIAEPIRAFGLAAARREIAGRVGALLRLVGLDPADGRKYPHEFSGGQRQRIAIARALASHPDFIVCDEPTSALDVSVQAQILNLMRDLQDQFGLTYLFISHNLAVVRHMASRVGVMYLGRLVEVAPAKELFSQPRHPYTRMLLDALPDVGMTGRPRKQASGGRDPQPDRPAQGMLVPSAVPARQCALSRRAAAATGGRKCTCGVPRGGGAADLGPPVFRRNAFRPQALYSVFRGVGSSPKMRAALSPRMLRLACSDRNGRSQISCGRSKSKCGQSDANISWVSALIISKVFSSAFGCVVSIGCVV